MSTLASRLKAADSSLSFRLLGVVKEVSTAPDDYLGLDKFRDYFPGGEIFFDEEMSFYSLLGKGSFRSMGLGSLFSWSMIKKYQTIGSKGMTGNLRGDGKIQGGVIVVGPGDQGVLYEHQEITGQDPIEFISDVEAAILKMGKTGVAAPKTKSSL